MPRRPKMMEQPIEVPASTDDNQAEEEADLGFDPTDFEDPADGDPLAGPAPSVGWGPTGIAENDSGHMLYDEEASIPIWEQFKQLQGTEAYSLRIQRMTPQGSREDLGHLEPDASHEMLVEHVIRLKIAVGEPPMAAAGRYLVMPVSGNGKPMRPEPYSLRIPGDHPTIIAAMQGRIDLRKDASATPQSHQGGYPMGMGMSPVAALGSPPVWDYLKQRDTAQATIEAERLRHISQKESEIAEANKDLRALQADLTDTHLSKVTSFMEKTFDAHKSGSEVLRQREAELAKAAIEQANGGWMQVMAFMQQQQAAERARAESAEREREERRRSDERERELRRQEHERAMAEIRQSERAAFEKAMALQLETIRGDAIRREATERERAEQRETFSKTMLELTLAQVKQQSPLGGLENLAKLKEVVASVKELTGEVKEEQSFMGEVREMVSDFMEANNERTRILANAGMLEDPEAAPPMQQAVIAPPRAIPQAPPQDDGVFWNGQIPTGQAFVAPGAQGLQNGAQPVVTLPPPPPPDPTAALPLDIRKQAKRLIRATVDRLREAPSDQWATITQAGVMANPQVVVPYLKAATVRRALIDAGADQAMVESILAGLKQQGLDAQVPLG